jgi:hypothetical protein
MVPHTVADDALETVRHSGAKIVFFNLTDFRHAAGVLRHAFKDQLKLFHLSHGMGSTDFAIDDQAKRQQADRSSLDKKSALKVGAALQFEADYRRYLDASLCISPLDAELEKWLGVPRTEWFPRPIRPATLNSAPIEGRVGCVATLNHPPNQLGLIAFLEAVARHNVRKIHIRLVGGPECLGQAFENHFSCVTYAGKLSDPELRQEVSSWCCFVNPVFAYARGCSTKIAMVLGWGLPLASARAGVRGYVWDDGILPLANTADELVDLVRQRTVRQSFATFSSATQRVANLQPPVQAIANAMRAFVMSVL